jgi:peptide/nickel transport system substrate-binding protein
MPMITSDRRRSHARRRVIAAMVAVTVTGLLAACTSSNSSSAPKTIGSSPAVSGSTDPSTAKAAPTNQTWLVPQDWGAIDPSQEASTNMGTILLVLEPLIVSDGKGGVISNLATQTHPTPDTFTYALHSGIKFSDGAPVTIADVLYSVQIHTAKGSKSNLAGNFSNVKSVTTSGDSLTFTLSSPDGQFPNYVAEIGIVEKSVREKLGPNPGTPGHLNVGSGPYTVTSYQPGNQVVLTRNESYWGTKPPVKTLTLRLVQNDSARLLAVKGGGITGAFEIPSSEIPVYKQISGYRVITGENDSVVILNVNNTVKPWNDPFVRKAVAMAIDKAGIVKAVLDGNGVTTPSVVAQSGAASELGASGAASLYQKLNLYPYNVDAAKAELAKSSVPNGFSSTIIYSQAEDTSGLVAQAVAQELKPLGINLTVKSEPDSQYTDAVFFKHTAPVSIVNFGTDIPDPVSMANYMSNSSGTLAKGGYTDIAEYVNPQQDDLLTQYLALPTTDTAQRGALLTQILTNLTNDEPYIPIYYANYTAVVSNKINWSTFDGNWYLRRWTDEITGK